MNKDRHHYFADQDEEVNFIIQNGMRKYVAGLDGVGRIFRSSDRILRCMDEGTPNGNVHRAGSGYNFGLKDTIEFAKRARVTAVSWHTFCGAVKLHLQGEGTSDITATMVDHEAKQFAEEVAAALGVECVEENLSRPEDLHVARCLYYDGTGQFDQTGISELPSGFALSRKFENDVEKAKWQAEVACDIAFDEHHGFGQLFTGRTPFLLIAVAEDEEQERKLVVELDEVVDNVMAAHPEWQGRIQVDSFTMQS